MSEHTKEVVANLLCYLIDNHENEPLSEDTLQQIGVKFLSDEQYRVVVNHTDPGEIKTALALAEKKLARVEKLNKVMYNALGKIKTIAGTIEGKGTLQASDIWNIIARVPTQAADKHLKDVLMPDKK